jgi:hypothetical protein
VHAADGGSVLVSLGTDQFHVRIIALLKLDAANV